MNSNLKNSTNQYFLGVEDQTQEAKTFIQDSFKIDYVNTSKIFFQESSNSSDVKVKNYLCYKSGQNLYKVTEIIYEDKLIRIEDKFEVSMNAANLGKWSSAMSHKIQREEKKYSRSNQKVRMFDKKTTKEQKHQKKDKKNIVKNVVKIFMSWLEKKQDGVSSFKQSQTLNQLKKLLQVENYNNRLIQKIAQNNQVNKVFFSFLEDAAEEEIRNSRIQDKQSHYQALQIYKNLLLKILKYPQQVSEDNRLSMSEADKSNQSMNSMDSIIKKHHLVGVEKFQINEVSKREKQEGASNKKSHENEASTKIIQRNNGSEVAK